MNPPPPRIGLALGSGSARGWSHLGVIRALERAGIVPDIVCGTSIGALVGAAYAAGQQDRLESWVRSLTWSSVAGLLDWKLGGGLMAGGKLAAFFRKNYNDPGMEHLGKAFGCAALLRCLAFSRRQCTKGACWWTVGLSTRCRCRCAAPWGPTS